MLYNLMQKLLRQNNGLEEDRSLEVGRRDEEIEFERCMAKDLNRIQYPSKGSLQIKRTRNKSCISEVTAYKYNRRTSGPIVQLGLILFDVKFIYGSDR